MKFSVIISTYNNWKATSRVLAELLGHVSDRSDVEVIVVDSSGDGSGTKLQRVFPTVKFILNEKRILQGAARRMGVLAAQGQYIILLDGDCIPAAGWLKGFEGALEKTADNVVCGAVDLLEPSYLSQFMEYVVWKLPSNSRVKRGPYASMIMDNMIMEASLAKKMLSFGNGEFGTDAEADVSRDQLHIGRYFEPNARVEHLHPVGAWRHIKKLYRTGIGLYPLIMGLEGYRMGYYQKIFFPFVFLLRWIRITGRVLYYKPGWMPRYLMVQPMLITGLLAFQAGLWQALGQALFLNKRSGANT